MSCRLFVSGVELEVGGMPPENELFICEENGAVEIRMFEQFSMESNPPECPLEVTTPAIRQEESPQEAVQQKVVEYESQENESLFWELAGLRNNLSSEQGFPPYVVFKDESLHEMARLLPANMEEFGNIKGVGKAKLEKYGEIFLEAIRKFKGVV